MHASSLSLLSERAGGETRQDRHRETALSVSKPRCSHQSFLLDPAYRGRLPEIKQQVIEMSLNGSGVRDTARMLKISTATVIHELKKKGLRSNPSTGPS